MLSREQYIGAAALLLIALTAWVFVVRHSPSADASLPAGEDVWAVRDSLRRDSIARVRVLRDSLRDVRWRHKRDSFRRVDSLRFAEWSRERQQRYDSFRLADSLWHDSVGWRYTRQEKRDTVLDLNTADTTALMLIRGIGRYKARRIVAYREQLGGFYSPYQLCDEALRDLALDTTLSHFTARPEDVRTLDVNRSGIDALARHPYLRYEQARAVYRLRRQRVRLTGIDDLQRLPELDSAALSRLRPYLRFE